MGNNPGVAQSQTQLSMHTYNKYVMFMYNVIYTYTHFTVEEPE